jgi:hypothetical protein
MRRNNEDRLSGGHKPTPSEDAPVMANPMDFITPTEFVDLPSKGRYPTGHPLSGQSQIEIRYMTARDEDVLTSRSLLKKGIAIDRLISNLIVDKTIDCKSLYIGDRNAIIVYARASAYGAKYKTKITCPGCSHVSSTTFSLSDYEEYDGTEWGELDIEDGGDGTFNVTLPSSKVIAKVRPLLGYDEAKMIQEMKKDKKGNDGLVTKQMHKFCISFNGYDNQETVNYCINNFTALDSRYLRSAFGAISPDLQIKDNFDCPECDHEEEMTVPFGADFFWPDR